jgi:hypothetical protein
MWLLADDAVLVSQHGHPSFAKSKVVEAHRTRQSLPPSVELAN